MAKVDPLHIIDAKNKTLLTLSSCLCKLVTCKWDVSHGGKYFGTLWTHTSSLVSRSQRTLKDVYLCITSAGAKIAPRDISNGNRTEWSPIRSVIIRVINKIGRPRSGSPI